MGTEQDRNPNTPEGTGFSENVPFVSAANAAYHGQAQPRPTAGPRPGGILAPEAGEHSLEGVIANAWSRILHHQAHPRAPRLQAEAYFSGRVGIAQGIFEQVVQKLSDAQRIEGKGERYGRLSERKRKARVLEAPLMTREDDLEKLSGLARFVFKGQGPGIGKDQGMKIFHEPSELAHFCTKGAKILRRQGPNAVLERL